MKNADAADEIAIGIPHSQCSPWREAIPAVEVDADEDRLEEERRTLERERQPDDAAGKCHEPRPQQPKLEADDRARRRPAPRTGSRIPSTSDAPGRARSDRRAQMHPLRNQHHQWQSHPEHREEQVKTQRRSHLRTTSRQMTDHTKRKRMKNGHRRPVPVTGSKRSVCSRIGFSTRSSDRVSRLRECGFGISTIALRRSVADICR